MEKKRIYFTSDPEEIRMHLEKLYAKISNLVKIEDSVKKQKREIVFNKKENKLNDKTSFSAS